MLDSILMADICYPIFDFRHLFQEMTQGIPYRAMFPTPPRPGVIRCLGKLRNITAEQQATSMMSSRQICDISGSIRFLNTALRGRKGGGPFAPLFLPDTGVKIETTPAKRFLYKINDYLYILQFVVECRLLSETDTSVSLKNTEIEALINMFEEAKIKGKGMYREDGKKSSRYSPRKSWADSEPRKDLSCDTVHFLNAGKLLADRYRCGTTTTMEQALNARPYITNAAPFILLSSDNQNIIIEDRHGEEQSTIKMLKAESRFDTDVQYNICLSISYSDEEAEQNKKYQYEIFRLYALNELIIKGLEVVNHHMSPMSQKKASKLCEKTLQYMSEKFNSLNEIRIENKHMVLFDGIKEIDKRILTSLNLLQEGAYFIPAIKKAGGLLKEIVMKFL